MTTVLRVMLSVAASVAAVSCAAAQTVVPPALPTPPAPVVPPVPVVAPAAPAAPVFDLAVAEALAAARVASVASVQPALVAKVVERAAAGAAAVAAEVSAIAAQPIVVAGEVEALAVEVAALAAEAALAQQAVVVERTAREEAAAKREQDRTVRHVTREVTREQSLYSRGQASLDAGRYNEAVQHFTAAAALAGPRADGALYWKAYAQYKLAQKLAALETLRALKQAHPSSNWMKDAKALEMEMSSASGATAATAEDDDLKLLALNSLIHADAELAIPMLEKILASQQSPRLKKRALFVLSQSKSPKGRQVLFEVAKGSSNPDLQLEALRYAGMFGGAENLRLLSDVYGTSKDVDVRRRILEAFMVSGQREFVLQAAKTEADAALRAQAVRLLGVMRATAELEKLYQTEISLDIKRAIVEAYMVGGDADRLVQVAKAERDDALRLRAIEMLGAMGRGKNPALLAGLYSAEGQTKDAKRAVINALYVAGDAKLLVDIARQETDPVLRKAAVERLSLMKSKEATDFLMELINK